MSDIMFVDVETTGLEPYHEAFEIVLASVDPDGNETIHQFWPGLTPESAVAGTHTALRLNRYWQRLQVYQIEHNESYSRVKEPADPQWPDFVHRSRNFQARDIATITAGKTLAGLNPRFDEGFLDRFLRDFGCIPAWDYHLVDVWAYLLGRLQADPPASSDELMNSFVDPPKEDRHTGLGDVLWTMRAFEKARKG